jgi:predicted RecB family nuclease
MVNWTLQSNACDVLGLGPRAAGRLATVGVRTVADLLAAKPQAAADKQYSADTIAAWQREARLIVSLPTLPNEAARLLAAAGVSSAERLARSTPTELIAKLEALWRDADSQSWLIRQAKPSSAEVCAWIAIAIKPSLQEAA